MTAPTPPEPIRCLGCKVPGQSLCRSCVGVLRMRCRAAAWLCGQLELEVTRQTQHGSPNREGGKSNETPLIFDDKASEAAWIMRSTIEAWAPDPGLGDTKRRAIWLADNLFRYMVSGEIVQVYREITEVCIVGMRVIDRPIRIYLGDCPHCSGVQIFGDPEEHLIACKACGRVMRTVELRADTRIRAREMWLTAAEAQRVLGEVYGVMITRKRINLWAHRGRIKAVEGRYLVADILDCAGAGMSHVSSGGETGHPLG